MADDEAWSPGRLRDRFDAILERFKAVEDDLRVLYPVAGQVAGAEADIDGLQRDVGALKAAVIDLDKGVTEVIRHSRAEQFKYLAYIVGPIIAVVGAIVLSGKGP